MNLIYIAAGTVIVSMGMTNCSTLHRLDAEKLAHQTTKTEFTEYREATEKASSEAEARNRNTEQELRNAQDKHATEAAALRKLADRHRANADAAGQRLQDAAADAAARAREKCADTGTSELRDPADDPIGMLGRVLSEVDNHTGAVASYADDARDAGLACEREYNTVRQAVNGVK
jgi:Tfp pilus assembly protein FimV